MAKEKIDKRRRLKTPVFQRIRLWIAACFVIITNSYWVGFIQGKVYKGPLKMACVPGLNCYACPGALGSCPIGALQNSFATGDHHPSFFVMGFLMTVGALSGRLTCGFLCPIGLLQDLLYKLNRSKKKLKSPKIHAHLRFLKYIILVVFVVLLPLLILDFSGQGSPWFCKVICPSGTILGGFPLAIANPLIRNTIGYLFAWKSLLVLFLIVMAIRYYRPFCKYICPLGAIYGWMNKIALFRLNINQRTCIKCSACTRVCPMSIDVMNEPNSVECIRCGRCVTTCPTTAIQIVTPISLYKDFRGCDGCNSCHQVQKNCETEQNSKGPRIDPVTGLFTQH